MASTADTLHNRLSQATPKGTTLKYHNISTPPTRCAALYNPPPQTRPQKTFCEPHTLLVTGSVENRDVAIFAIELQIYTTRQLTTVFVSKADSTGYASLINIPKTAGSLLQSLTQTFVSWTIRHRHRCDRPLVLSLFARAQNQYLFPGSSENPKKHILSDRDLVKWWCKTLDPVLHEYDPARPIQPRFTTPKDPPLKTAPTITSTAHLIVPGHDPLETTRFFPASHRSSSSTTHKRWHSTSPSHTFSPYPTSTPRTQIPHFPDDPKSRFLDELDSDLADALPPTSSSSQTRDHTVPAKHESPRKRGGGVWAGVRSLEEFWECMAFRQECSSGRLVGFLWMVFRSVGGMEGAEPVFEVEEGDAPPSMVGVAANKRSAASAAGDAMAQTAEQKDRTAKRRKPLSGPIIPRAPRIKSSGSSLTLLSTTEPNCNHTPTANTQPATNHPDHTLTAQTSSTMTQTSPHYNIPHTTGHIPSSPTTTGTGPLLLPEKAYTRAHDILLRSDFSNLDTAAGNTGKWVREVGLLAGLGGGVGASGMAGWGVEVVGVREVDGDGRGSRSVEGAVAGGGVNVLGVRKKAKAVANPAAMTTVTTLGTHVNASETQHSSSGADTNGTAESNDLPADLVRKKRAADAVVEEKPAAENINTLDAGLIRKKAKAS